MPSNTPTATRYTVTLAPHQSYQHINGADIQSEEPPNTMRSLPDDDDDEDVDEMTGVEEDEDLIAVSLLEEQEPQNYPQNRMDGFAPGLQVGQYREIAYPGYEEQMITTAWGQQQLSKQAAETSGQAAAYGIRHETYSIVSHGHRRSETPALQTKRMERKEMRKQRDPTAREQTVKDLKHVVEAQNAQLERLFTQNAQLMEQNNHMAMQFASRPQEAALEERIHVIAEELNRERNQRQIDLEDAEKKRNEDIAKLQAENEQRVRVAELQNDEKFHKAQQDAETRIKAMQAERDNHVTSMATKIWHTMRHVSKPRESSPVALRSRKSPTPALYEDDEAMEDGEGSNDQKSAPSRLRDAIERINTTPKPKSKLRIVEKSPAIKARSIYQTPKTKLTVKKNPRCNSEACESTELAVRESTALEQKVDKLAELVYKLCEQSPTDSPRSKSARRRSGVKKELEEEKVEMDPEWHKYYLGAVRATFGAVFGTGGTKEFYCHESAEPEDVEAFTDDGGVGPVVGDLRFDMNTGKTSRWNQHVFSLLLQGVKSVITEDDDPPSDTYLIGLIQNRFIRCRDVWRLAQAKPKEDGSAETADEVANRLNEQNSQMKTYRRQNTRRINRFQRREKICTKKIEYYEEMSDDDGQLALWQQAKRIIGELGVEGMSSDESSPEDGSAGKLRVKKMPWRRDVLNLLEAVDGERVIDVELYSKRGSKPLPRVRKDFYPSSRRDPVCGLQGSLYDVKWLGQQEKEFVTMKLRPRPDEEDFEILEVEVE